MDELASLELETHERLNECHIIPTLHSFLGGCVSGVASLIAGQPFDTVKVRMQTSSSYRSAGDCLRQLLAKEGPQALFKGMSSPVLSASFVNAIVFSSYNETMTLIKKDCEGKPTYAQVFIAGSVAGGAQCSVLCPTELVKCRLQVAQSTVGGGPLQCIREVYRERGVRGFYAGLGPILLRDLPAFGCYFSLYEIVKDALETQGRSLWLSSCVAGGVAGVVSWAVVYPMDVLKSVVQTQPLTGVGSQQSMLGTARDLLRSKGPRVFFRGMSVALVRALPVNCIVFPVYEYTVGFLGKVDSAHDTRGMPKPPPAAAAMAAT